MSTPQYLEPVDDGLPMRPSGAWAKDKLSVLARYIATSTTAMKKLPWRKRFYIDLQAGPGKNYVDNSETKRPEGKLEIFLGSPLLALTEGVGFTDYFFVEKDGELALALETRCSLAPPEVSVRVIQGDCNSAIDEIVQYVWQVDQPPFSQTDWNSLCLAFLDPEGLELNWSTVEKLASLKRADLVINFSIGGLRRSAEQAWKTAPEAAKADSFFGTTDWRSIPRKPKGSMPSVEWIDFYRSRVTELGYEHWGTPVSVKYDRGVELYRLLFASKHELGVKLWEDARKNAPIQRSLF